jgi:hypothetical protein
MANINAGTVTLGEGTYEVILRRVTEPVWGQAAALTYLDASNGVRSNVNPTRSRRLERQEALAMDLPSGGKRRAKKQEGGKTRKLSPYMKFAQEARPKIIKENPELKSDIPGMGRKIGEMWRALSDSEKKQY